MTIYGGPWLSMVSSVVDAASKSVPLATFHRFIDLIPPVPGKGPLDWERVLSDLVDSNSVKLIDGNLRLGDLSTQGWLKEALSFGAPEAWQIVESVDPTGELARKFDSNILTQIGDDGEEAVMREISGLLPRNLLNRLQRVSLIDDSLGYDILSPTINGLGEVYLEVKTTTRPINSGFQFHISKNEASVGGRTENWFIVAVHSHAGIQSILGHLEISKFSGWLPKNQHQNSSWDSASVKIATDLLKPGLPL